MAIDPNASPAVNNKAYQPTNQYQVQKRSNAPGHAGLYAVRHAISGLSIIATAAMVGGIPKHVIKINDSCILWVFNPRGYQVFRAGGFGVMPHCSNSDCASSAQLLIKKPYMGGAPGLLMSWHTQTCCAAVAPWSAQFVSVAVELGRSQVPGLQRALPDGSSPKHCGLGAGLGFGVVLQPTPGGSGFRGAPPGDVQQIKACGVSPGGLCQHISMFRPSESLCVVGPLRT